MTETLHNVFVETLRFSIYKEFFCDLMPSLLLVEDSADDETFSVRGIEASEVTCEVSVVRNGTEALRILLSEDGPTPDLIILDFHLPGLNGLEILRGIRGQARTRRVPVVLLSSLASPKTLSECLEEGVNSIVKKSDDFETYTQRVALIVRYWLTVDERPLPAGTNPKEII